MKLKLYQQGGGLIYTPFIPGQSIAASGSSSSNSSDSEDAKIDPLDKVLMDLMKDQNLLPSDIDAIYRNLIKFQKSTQYLSSSDGYRSVMPGMLKIMNMTSVAKTNKEQWDNSLSEIRKHDAGSEVAMDSYGRIWVSDGSDIKKIELSEFDPSKYNPLSNSQLLYMRQRNPQLGFSDMFDDTWTDIVGINDVRKEIYEVIDKFGTIKSAKFQKQVFKDIAEDLKGEGIYKITTKYSKADLNDFSGLLYDQLSKEAQNLINANAKINGFDRNEFIRTIIDSRTNVEVDPSYEASLTKANGLGGEGGSGSDGDEKNLTAKNYVEQVITGSNFEWPQNNRFSVIGTHSDIWAFTQNTGLIQSGMDGGKGVGYMPVNLLRDIEVFAQGSNQQNITFGDQQISTAQQAGVMYDDSAMYRVELPSREENGDIVPDWNTINLMEELRDRINHNAGKDQIDRILHEYDSDLYWDENTNTIVCNRSHWFLTFTGIVGSDFINNLDYNSDFFEEITGPDSQIWHSRYDEAMKQNGKSAVSEGRFGWLTRTKLYKANVFMPITNPLAGSTEYYSKNARTRNMQTQALNQHKAEIQKQMQNGTINTNWDYAE